MTVPPAPAPAPSPANWALPLFRSPALLAQALTHRSYVNEHPQALHNERLEFLGDALLTFLAGAWVFEGFGDRPEGDLTVLRTTLVDEAQLAGFARWLDLGPKLRLGRGAEQQGGRVNANLLSSAFEAVVGAYWLDQGGQGTVISPEGEAFVAVQGWVLPFFEGVRSGLVGQPVQQPASRNYKSLLQEALLARGLGLPSYEVVEAIGPDHDRRFGVVVSVGGQVIGRGQGARKQVAEQAAAQDALGQYL